MWSVSYYWHEFNWAKEIQKISIEVDLWIRKINQEKYRTWFFQKRARKFWTAHQGIYDGINLGSDFKNFEKSRRIEPKSKIFWRKNDRNSKRNSLENKWFSITNGNQDKRTKSQRYG